MKIFISWSGDYSKLVAELLRDWIQCVLQTSEPWVSSKDLERGTVWFSDIRENLDKAKAGIICLTQENKVKPWILFEAGAIFKGLEENRICTFLADLEPKDVGQPLAQFNHTMPTKDSLRSLVQTLNKQLENKLRDVILDQIFETYWPNFERDFKAIPKPEPTDASAPRNESDILSEILEATRSIGTRVAKLENAGRKMREKRILRMSPGAFESDSTLSAAIKELKDIGFDREEVRDAIEQSTDNPKVVARGIDIISEHF